MGKKAALGCFFAFVLASAGLYLLLKSRPDNSGWTTVQDLSVLEHEARNRPDDPDAQVELVIAYAGLLGQFGDLERATKGTLELGVLSPEFGAKPYFRQKKVEILAALAKIRRKVGIESEQHFRALLSVAIETASTTLQRKDLSNSQRAVCHLSRGRIYLQKDQFKEAIDDAKSASASGGDPVMVELLKGDALVELGLWRKAVESYKAAIIGLSAWANRQPDWELRLMWSMRRGRSYRYERRWRERRQEIAGNLRYVISDQIRVLQGLEMLEGKGPNRDSRIE